MIATTDMTPEQIIRKGFQVLAKELGPYGYAVFLQHLTPRGEDYTAERRARLEAEDESVDQVLEKIKQTEQLLREGKL